MIGPIDLDGQGTGVIVLYKSGIQWTSQTGGTRCEHPVEEGIYVPIRDGTISDILSHDLAERAIDDDVSRILYNMTGFEVEPLMRKFSMEAWVYVRLPREFVLGNHLPDECGIGVLVWPNSD